MAYADSQSLSIKRRPPMEAVTPSVGREIQGQLESITVRKVCRRGHKKVPSREAGVPSPKCDVNCDS